MSTNPMVLETLMQTNDAKAHTVRDYLKALLSELWVERECFSGKRPFGNSGWQYDIYQALGHSGLIKCTFDEEGCIAECDDKAADILIADAIKTL